MLFARKSLGVEISPGGISFALLGGSAASPHLERVAARPLEPGVLRVSLREQNILDPEKLAERLRETHSLLLHKGTRLSVSLPDGVGRLLLLDVEGRFKNRNEALDIIRWKLKKSIPFDINDTHLDYQLLKIRESGDMSLLVALVSRTVIEQYEAVISAAGFTPAKMDLNVFNLCRAFQQHLDLLNECILIAFYGNTLGIIAFNEGFPEFIRIKDLPSASAVDSRVFMEINSSMLVWQERFPERTAQKTVCIAAPDVAVGFCDMVSEAMGIQPLLLEAKSTVRPANDAPADQVALFPYTAAIGAALRNL